MYVWDEHRYVRIKSPLCQIAYTGRLCLCTFVWMCVSVCVLSVTECHTSLTLMPYWLYSSVRVAITTVLTLMQRHHQRQCFEEVTAAYRQIPLSVSVSLCVDMNYAFVSSLLVLLVYQAKCSKQSCLSRNSDKYELSDIENTWRGSSLKPSLDRCRR